MTDGTERLIFYSYQNLINFPQIIWSWCLIPCMDLQLCVCVWGGVSPEYAAVYKRSKSNRLYVRHLENTTQKSAFIDSSRIKHCKWRDLLYDDMKGTSRNDFTGWKKLGLCFFFFWIKNLYTYNLKHNKMDCTILEFWLETVTQFCSSTGLCDGHKMENYEYIH